MKTFMLSLFLIGSYFGNAQTELNDYKYIIVPKKFEDFKKENQYQTSTGVKHRFIQKGFTAVYEDALPEELILNRCLGLTASLKDDSSMFKTKARLVLKDCASRIVFETKVGESRIKEFQPAYREVINDIFTCFTGNYVYKPQEKEAPLIVSFKNDVKKMEPIEETTTIKKPKAMVEQKATIEEQSFKSMEPVVSEIKKGIPSPIAISLKGTILYAQEIANGFQLVDSTPKIQLKVYKSSIQDFFLARADDKNGVVYSKNNKWFFEYYKGEELVIEELNIKF